MKIVLKNRQRAELAALFAHQDLKLDNIDEMKAYNRARRALRLHPIMDLVTRQGAQARAETLGDPTAYAFELDAASANLIMTKVVAPVLAHSGLMMILGDFLEDLDAGGSKAEGAAPPENEVWAAEPGPRSFEELRAFMRAAGASPADVLALCETCVAGGLPA